jgi:hypothetical protein
MALIAVAADKGAPGVTTGCLALAAVWPRPVLLAECDPAGGDLVYRLPAAGGGRLDPGRGLVSLAVAVRRGLPPEQAWEHAQKLPGGLDVLAGVVTAEQGTGLDPLWGPVGSLLARLPGADVIADCGRIGADGPFFGLLAEACLVALVTRAGMGELVRLRERAAAVGAALAARGRPAGPASGPLAGVPGPGPGPALGAVVVAGQRDFHAALAEAGRALGGCGVSVLGGLAYDPRAAAGLAGEWGGRLDRSLLIRTARELAARLAAQLAGAQLLEAPARSPEAAPLARSPEAAPLAPHPRSPEPVPAAGALPARARPGR